MLAYGKRTDAAGKRQRMINIQPEHPSGNESPDMRITGSVAVNMHCRIGRCFVVGTIRLQAGTAEAAVGDDDEISGNFFQQGAAAFQRILTRNDQSLSGQEGICFPMIEMQDRVNGKQAVLTFPIDIQDSRSRA